MSRRAVIRSAASGKGTAARAGVRGVAVGALALLGLVTAGSAAAVPAPAAVGGAASAKAAAPRCDHTGARPVLRQGDTGPAVKQAQCYLLYTLIIDDIIEVDGDFDAETGIRVRQFQACAGLSVDGVVRAGTWTALETYFEAGRTC